MLTEHSERVAAQPAPSFLSSCQGLRDALAQLGWDGETLTTISVEGELTIAQRESGIAFMGLCAPADMQVLCVTYDLDDYEVGDRVVVTGAIDPQDEDHLVLDPCLHHPADD